MSDRRRRVTLAACLALPCAVVAAVVLEQAPTPAGGATPRKRASVGLVIPSLAPPATSALHVPRWRPLRGGRGLARWAPVVRRVAARRSPSPQGPPIASVARFTSDGTTNIVLVLRTRRAASGLWAEVRFPVLPNDLTGWLPRSALGGYHFVATHLVVDLERLRATLYRRGRAVFRAPVGVGQAQWPTPRGEFYVRDELTRYASPVYGPIAFGTSARSAVLTDWPGGGFVGIHGTDEPELIPGRISHGCIRLRNADILRLARLMPVGTPLTIR